MQVAVVTAGIAQFQADAIVVNLFQGVTRPSGGTGEVDKALEGLLSNELENTRAFKGKLGETLVLPTYGKIPARYVVIVGLGKREELTAFELRRASAAAIRACKKLKVSTIGTLLHGAGIGGFIVPAAARALVEGALLGSYKFTRRKSKKDDDEDNNSIDIETLTIVEHDATKVADIERGAKEGKIIAECVNLARDFVFDSANHVTPTYLKEQAEAIKGLSCKVLDFKEIKKLGMGAFELVAKGSDEPPFLVHLSYKPKGTPRKKVALVGKGLTFDSGGLSLKPPKSMETMKMDMAGAAAVIATMKAIAERKDLDIQVDGFVGLCENMPSARSSKPGDIITAMNGKTIEVNNTDAEGRLVLADVLTYAQKQAEPDEIIDLATLTGACVVALGHVAAGVMGNNQELVDNLRKAGEQAGEKLWQLPLYDEYKKSLKSDVADLINAGSKGEAGSSSAGIFLQEFIEEKQAWSHIDIAGPAYISQDYPEIPKGATGFGVRTLLYYLYSLSAKN